MTCKNGPTHHLDVGPCLMDIVFFWPQALMVETEIYCAVRNTVLPVSLCDTVLFTFGR